MNKETYLKQLKSKLKRMPSHEVKDALEYYNEYFDEAGEENAQQVIKELGSPAQVASKILVDYTIKDLDDHPGSTKKGLLAIWIIILTIFATPIGLPIMLTVVLLIFTVILLCGSLVIAAIAILFSLILGGIGSLIGGISVLTQHIPTALFFIGLGLIASGIGLLVFTPVMNLIKNGSRVIAKMLKRLFDRITKRSKEGL